MVSHRGLGAPEELRLWEAPTRKVFGVSGAATHDLLVSVVVEGDALLTRVCVHDCEIAGKTKEWKSVTRYKFVLFVSTMIVLQNYL